MRLPKHLWHIRHKMFVLRWPQPFQYERHRVYGGRSSSRSTTSFGKKFVAQTWFWRCYSVERERLSQTSHWCSQETATFIQWYAKTHQPQRLQWSRWHASAHISNCPRQMPILRRWNTFLPRLRWLPHYALLLRSMSALRLAAPQSKVCASLDRTLKWRLGLMLCMQIVDVLWRNKNVCQVSAIW